MSQVAAQRCGKSFTEAGGSKDKELKSMLDWAMGGFLPSEPAGFNPPAESSGMCLWGNWNAYLRTHSRSFSSAHRSVRLFLYSFVLLRKWLEIRFRVRHSFTEVKFRNRVMFWQHFTEVKARNEIRSRHRLQRLPIGIAGRDRSEFARIEPWVTVF